MNMPIPLARLAVSFVLAGALLAAAAPVTLSRSRFPAGGRHEAILEIAQAGRYSVVCRSRQGSRIQIVDRMAGPAESAGNPGGVDGRLDLLLDVGQYKLLIDSPEEGRGEVLLEAHPFRELQAPEPPLLVEHRLVRDLLQDRQQRSWWIHVPRRMTVYVEAQGRSLADLRLWKDGLWLQDARPELREIDSGQGRSERNAFLAVDLTEGHYLLTAYGGAPLAWPRESADHPFSLRMGIPQLPGAFRMDGVVSPFGVDRYLVSREADTYLLQLPEKRDARLEVGPFSPGDRPGRVEARAALSRKSADPECKLRHASSRPFSLVNVWGAPGDRYVLQAFEARETHALPVPAASAYRLTTLHSGHLEDQIDATGILVATDPSTGRGVVHAADVLPLGGEKAWARRFNLLGTNTLFFFVETAGEYQVFSSGTPAGFRFEPFLLERPANYRTPDFKDQGGVFSLDRGYWMLTLEPRQKGILKVAVQSKGYSGGLKEWVQGGPGASPMSAKGACTLDSVLLDPKQSYRLVLNRQDGVERGVVLRPLPLDLQNGLPVTLRPGEQARLPFTASQEGRLRILALQGAPLACQVDGKSWSEAMVVASGPHEVLLRNEGPRTLTCTLQSVPASQAPEAPLPPLDGEAKARLQQPLPALSAQAPLFLDLGVQEARSALLSVATPGLYRVETTGLLKTSLTLRSAVRTRLFSAEANGVGRNALLSAYLKAGQYLVTVQTRDQSTGHLGLQVARTDITDGGELAFGRTAKAQVEAHRGVLYTFEIPRKGSHLLRTQGVGRHFPSRLEDRDGWPLLAPGFPSDLTRDFAPGRYRYFSLPVDVDTQRITTLAPVLGTRAVEGKGPHPLELNVSLSNIWRETEKTSSRARDLYTLAVPAEVDATVSFDSYQMRGFLFRPGEEPRVIPPGKGWSGSLPPGEYRLEVECGRINDLVEYTVKVQTSQLASGLRQEVKVPGQLEVRLAQDAVVELFSTGPTDVRASLFREGAEADGPLETSDDSFRDWNFRMARPLAAGRYRLQVEPVGVPEGTTVVGMETPAVQVHEPMPMDGDRSMDLEGRIHVLPLEPRADGDLLAVRITGAAQYGCILEGADGAPLLARTGQDLAFEVPIAAGAPYRLRLWSADHQSEQVRLRLKSLVVPGVPLERLAQARALPTVEVHGRSLAFARIAVDRGGTFRAEPGGVACSTAREHPLEAAPSPLLFLPAGPAVLRWEGSAPRVSLVREVLENRTLRVQVPKGIRSELDIRNALGGPTVVLARAQAGRAACAPEPLSKALALGPDFAATVLPAGTGRIQVWDPSEHGPALGELEVTARGFRPSAEASLEPGIRDGSLAAGEAGAWSLPAGGKQVDLVLEEGLVACLSEGSPEAEQVTAVACARGETVHASFHATATRLRILSLAPGRAAYSIDLRGRPEPVLPGSLLPGQPLERVLSQGGTFRIEVKGVGSIPSAPAAGTLVVSGPGVEAQWLDASGMLREGLRHEILGEGILLLSARPGLLKAWIAPPGRELEARWGSAVREPEAPLPLGRIVPLDGAIRWFTFQVGEPTAFRVRVDAPAVLALADASALRAVSEGASAATLEACLEPGSYRLGVRALPGEVLRGAMETSFTELVPISRTFGPETLIRPGESRTFSFAVKARGSLGLGVKASRDVLSCELLKGSGQSLGTGIQQFVELEPGTYLLRISLPPGEEPVKFTPVVVGLERPGDGPPPEVLQEFLAGLGLGAPRP